VDWPNRPRQWCVTNTGKSRKPTGACWKEQANSARVRPQPKQGREPPAVRCNNAAASGASDPGGPPFYATVQRWISTADAHSEETAVQPPLRAGMDQVRRPKAPFKATVRERKRPPRRVALVFCGDAEGLIIQRPQLETAFDLGKVSSPYMPPSRPLADCFTCRQGRAALRLWPVSSRTMRRAAAWAWPEAVRALRRLATAQ